MATFGRLTKGGSARGDPWIAIKCLFPLTEDGIVTKLSAAFINTHTSSLDADIGIYSGTTLLKHLVVSVPASYDDFIDANIDDVSCSAGVYGLAVKTKDTEYSRLRLYYDTGTANQEQDDTGLLGTDNLPDPFDVNSQLARENSVYATYTPTPPVVGGVTKTNFVLTLGILNRKLQSHMLKRFQT